MSNASYTRPMPLAQHQRARWLPDRVLLRWRIGTRLLALMLLATLTALWLGAYGLRGMATSVAELRRVHDERMTPVRTLSQIAQLMRANQYQLQLALARIAGPDENTLRTPPLAPAAAHAGASAIAENARQITTLWQVYAAGVPAEGQEEAQLAALFAAQRDAYLSRGIDPALAALREQKHVQESADRAQELFLRADQSLQALIALQFTLAQRAYADGMARYAHTRNLSLAALVLALALLGALGWGQIRAIVLPLRQVRAVFQRLARGQFDTDIAITGRDEISALLRDLAQLQRRLADNEREIAQLIHYDPLTGLPNRQLLRKQLAQALNSATAARTFRALLLLDLDDFKNINDTQGHEIGDLYLQEVARRLMQLAPPPHCVARIGGDEFVVLTTLLGEDAAGAQERARALAQQLLSALSAPWLAQGRQHHGSASVGLCLFLPGQASVAELLKRADLAMYQAKASGRNQLCLFDPQLQTELEQRTTLTQALRDALALGQLALHLQPQVDAQGRVLGAEALLRWQHPARGLVAPDVFIPLAEASALILPIGAWVLEQACTQLKAWQQSEATRTLELAVNVGPREFKQVDFAAQVERLLDRHGVDASRLVLELTENLIIDDIDDTIDKMSRLHHRGVRFALDDFGTGHSSLTLLRQLPLQLLKIDRSFVRDVAHDEGSATIVRATIALAHSLGLQVIAEGVENALQLQALQKKGCALFQGYLFARPMPRAQFAPWLESRSHPLATTEKTPS